MALLPPIPDRPTGRPETWSEYQHRRAVIAMHRSLLDEIGACFKRDPFNLWGLSQVRERQQFCAPTWDTGRFEGSLSDEERRRIETSIC